MSASRQLLAIEFETSESTLKTSLAQAEFIARQVFGDEFDLAADGPAHAVEQLMNGTVIVWRTSWTATKRRAGDL